MIQLPLDLGKTLVFTLFLDGFFQPIYFREWMPELKWRWLKLILYSFYIIFSYSMRIEYIALLVFQNHIKYTKINFFCKPSTTGK